MDYFAGACDNAQWVDMKLNIKLPDVKLLGSIENKGSDLLVSGCYQKAMISQIGTGVPKILNLVTTEFIHPSNITPKSNNLDYYPPSLASMSDRLR